MTAEKIVLLFLCIKKKFSYAKCALNFTGDGLIKLHELKAVLAACSEENGMKFSDEQLDQLTWALYEDAMDCRDGDSKAAPGAGLEYEHLLAQMAKHPGLLDNLSIR